jgi:hypothetical protein
MGCMVFMLRSHYLEKELRYPQNSRLGGPQSLFGRFEEDECLALMGMPNLCCPVRSLVKISIEPPPAINSNNLNVTKKYTFMI